MSTLFNIALLIAAGIGIAYLIIKRKKKTGVKKVVVVDPVAQELYTNQKHKQNEEKKLTLEEKIELSWQFLVNIKNQVLQKFSKSDQEKVARAGTILIENGMKYQHDVEQEAQISQEHLKAKSVNKPKEQPTIVR